jgi:hypothetical protein
MTGRKSATSPTRSCGGWKQGETSPDYCDRASAAAGRGRDPGAAAGAEIFVEALWAAGDQGRDQRKHAFHLKMASLVLWSLDVESVMLARDGQEKADNVLLQALRSVFHLLCQPERGTLL